jgi:hypothetical protein
MPVISLYELVLTFGFVRPSNWALKKIAVSSHIYTTYLAQVVSKYTSRVTWEKIHFFCKNSCKTLAKTQLFCKTAKSKLFAVVNDQYHFI